MDSWDEREHRTPWGPQPESLAALNAWGAGKGAFSPIVK